MLNHIIIAKAKEWIYSPGCPVRQIVDYIRTQNHLREAQVEAIEVYLYLKIKGQNKPLATLFKEGFFLNNEFLSELPLSISTRTFLENNQVARALFEFARTPQPTQPNKHILPDIEKRISENPESIDYEPVISNLFYGVSYSDYLFSLPMGAGKTFLMASFIYLDLYFALLEPENKAFAHNFLILVPSGLKTSIIPSLKTIENFNPAWVIPEPSASQIKKLIKFEVLDQPKSAKKSNKARNPNAQKVSQYQPFEDVLGLILVTNAEKVILDRLELGQQQELIEKTDDEKDKAANELRNLIGKISNLQILIDEVHHAATDDVKLRRVVNRWNAGGNINSVLGFSGTPYLASAERIEVSDGISLKLSQITNTVYYYPLVEAVRHFLKNPDIKTEPTKNLTPLQIIRRGVEDFEKLYKNKIYDNGTCAKLAIYCGKIERLEEEVYPFLVNDLEIEPDEILRFHQGNKSYKLPKENAQEFSLLDTQFSKKRIVLLVQIGKEGWDCKSLTGVILSQQGDCPSNMVLQTACRCLREVDRNHDETALIWLNESNAKVLDKQLKEEQNTTINELKNAGKADDEELIERHSRLSHLRLPEIEFWQLKIKHDTLLAGEKPNPQATISGLDTDSYFKHAVIITKDFTSAETHNREFLQEEKGDAVTFDAWLLSIAKSTLGTLTFQTLNEFRQELKGIFERITVKENDVHYYNELFDRSEVEAEIRLAFHQRRELQTHEEVIPAPAQMLIVSQLAAIAKHDKLYPNEKETQQILRIDASGKTIAETEKAQVKAFRQMQEQLAAQGMSIPPNIEIKLPLAVQSKEKTFHYLPYNFAQSRFEKNILEGILTISDFRERELEIYYNGEKDITNFRIECLKKNKKSWFKVGKYTPDFLLLERKENEIFRVLIIETKGSGFADQPGFINRREFVEKEFIPLNNDKFGYKKFEYLYLPDSEDFETNLSRASKAIREFFTN
jgi:sortase (surface protein transpeptidase)